jgi:hypothetical protein
MWIYNNNKEELETILSVIDNALGYPNEKTETWANIMESEIGTYLMSISEYTKQYLTSEQELLIVNDIPTEFIEDEDTI